ncbi:hypothetical protein D5281_22560 [bacterium 1xD42-62]|uniref:Uncharacterized protein n=1 Tax=Parablautia muri TaxID=2320879 RepID=A0A9X5BK76_9FIRM|nr:hypothetical protein [Parablautia muri]
MEQLSKEDKHENAKDLVESWQNVYKQAVLNSNPSEPMVRDLILKAFKCGEKGIAGCIDENQIIWAIAYSSAFSNSIIKNIKLYSTSRRKKKKGLV